MKTKFITCIYSDLNGTDLGGRPGRNGHYRWSLLSLLKMTEADFLCYTSEREYDSLINFFYNQHQISKEKLEIRVFDITKTRHSERLNSIKQVDEIKRGDRCLEIQYAKFEWFDYEDGSYDYYYWIDAGLSHVGLFPNKYLTSKHIEQRYYECNQFNNEMLKNLIEFTGDKFFMIAKDNERNYWSGTVNPKWYINYDRSLHVVGGLFGGRRDKWRQMVDLFDNYLTRIMDEDNQHPYEELIMTLISFNHPELVNKKFFDVWWSPDSGIKGLQEDFFVINRSFYKIFEEFNNIYE
jgi:hypothetical protein